MRVALYARFSTDLQRPASIEDQFRSCAQVVEREGWQVVAQFKDEALSGAKADRPGYQALLEAAKRGEIDLIVVEEVSRLWRDQEEQWRAVRRLEHWDVHILGVNDGINTRSEGYGLLLSIRGAMNEEARREIGKRTHRGLSGVALKGNSAGGRSYGYRNVPIEDLSRRDQYGRPTVIAVRREVDEEQAKWVRVIFERYADGASPRRIADELNRLGVPPPGATWNRKLRRCKGWAGSAIYGDQKRGFGILLNPLYGGVYIWNRTRRKTDPDSKARKHAARPEGDWIVTQAPELRIVSEDLWDRVQARLAARRVRHQPIGNGAGPGRGPKYLFSGLLKCGVCAGNFVIMNATSYGCATNKDRGPYACSNRLRVARRVVEEKLLDGLKHGLLNEENVTRFRQEFARLLKSRRKAQDVTAERRKLAQTEKAIRNVITAIKAGIVTTSTKAELESLEADRERLVAAIEGAGAVRDNVADLVPHLVETYQGLVATLETVTLRDVSRARDELRRYIHDEAIRLVPEGDHLVAEFSGSVVGLLKMTGTENNSLICGTEERT